MLSGLRDGMIKRGLWTDPVGLLRALGATVQTNVPREMLPSLADAMGKVDRTRTYRTVIEYPLVVGDMDPDLGSVQILDIKGIKALAARLFPASGTLPDAAFAVAPPAAEPGASAAPGGATPVPVASSAPAASHSASPDRKSTRLNSSHMSESRMPSSA